MLQTGENIEETHLIVRPLEDNFSWCLGNDHLELCAVNLGISGVSGVGGDTDSPSAVVLHGGVFQLYPVSSVLLCHIAWEEDQ